jgi:hypothetical protein
MRKESETVLLEQCLSVFARKNRAVETGENESHLQAVLIFPRLFIQNPRKIYRRRDVTSVRNIAQTSRFFLNKRRNINGQY